MMEGVMAAGKNSTEEQQGPWERGKKFLIAHLKCFSRKKCSANTFLEKHDHLTDYKLKLLIEKSNCFLF